MNQGIFRLVYSKVLNMYVPASEAVKARGGKGRDKRVRKLVKKAFIVIFIGSTPYALADAPEGLKLDSATGASVASTTANSMTIQQTVPKAILDWRQLNLKAGELLRFDQMGNRNWSALNRINDIAPSQIFGTIKADGNLYLINPNGILFGSGSQVDVGGSLYAGSLNITDDLFNRGLLSDPKNPVFSATGGFVMVEEGAKLYAESGGRIVLLAPDVENHGLIETPDGQTILAAGNKVYLQALTSEDVENSKFSDENPAHLLVEVDAGGEARNVGKILADRGNVTMVGLAVNQEGVISASTSVRANGVVTLKAVDTVNTNDVVNEAVNYRPQRGGKVTLSENSVTEVRIEVEDKEEVSQAQLDELPIGRSKVNISGKDVTIAGSILANSGEVNISNGKSTDPNNIKMDRVYLAESSKIDVSGIDATAPMERNQLEIELFSDQLKDVPLLRDSEIFKEKVYVDKRKGTAITDTTPFEKLKKKTVAEIFTDGGKVTLGGEVIQRKGSVVDVSGGSTTFLPGAIKETTLVYNGKNYAISEIDPNTTLPKTNDFLIVSNEKWGTSRVWDLSGGGTKGWGKLVKTSDLNKIAILGTQQAGYKIGDDAGEIAHVDSDEVSAVSAFTVMDGTVLANTYTGETQRLPGQAPKGGKISLTGNFSAQGEVLSDDFDENSAYDSSSLRKFNTDFIKNGFNQLRLSGEVNENLVVDPNGSVTLTRAPSSTAAKVNADIIASGGDITISAADIADGVTIRSAGNFTNDSLSTSNRQQAIAVNAGNVELSGTIGNDVTIDASAGAFVDAKGNTHLGEAGNITISNAVANDYINTNNRYQAYGFEQGGSLTINTVNDISVGSLDTNAASFVGNFFQRGGFSQFTINSTGSVSIGDGSAVDVYTSMQTLQLDGSLSSKQNQQSILGAAPIWTAPAVQRKASSISLASTGTSESLVLAENAKIRTDAEGTVSLAADRKMGVLGDIETPAGNINLSLDVETQSGTYSPTNGIFIGDQAKLSAKGVYRRLPSQSTGAVRGEVLGGGNVNILGVSSDTGLGAVVVKEGAVIDVSAATGINDAKFASGIRRETLYGDAGAITVTARDGMLLDGDFKGTAKGTGRGGTLALRTQSVSRNNVELLPLAGTDFTITQNKTLQADGLSYGDNILPNVSGSQVLSLKGNAQISADQIRDGGFDQVAIQNTFGNRINFEAGTDLSVPGALRLEARQIAVEGNGQVDVSAKHVTLSEQAFVDGTRIVTNIAPQVASTTADNSIQFNADQVLIRGQVKMSGVNRTSINAEQDISGSGLGNALDEGRLTAPGEINLTARQIYPNTANKLTIEATGDDSKITVDSSGQAAKPVLSAQGELTLKADNITQNGTLKAPFGKINLEAADSLTLGENSLTSVSAEGQLIPFSTTRLSGQQYSTEAYQGLEGTDKPLDAKAINLTGDTIDQKESAVIDIAGGGDMFAYEFIPGIGGSEDVLSKEGYFAVLPSVGTDYAPIDSIYQNSSDKLDLGETVYLTGIPGLKTGTYTKLPARYALMPGAYLVKEGVSQQLDRGLTSKQLDGAYLTTGYHAELTTGARDAEWSTFKVVSGKIFRPANGAKSKAPSEYLITSANGFFKQQGAATAVKQALPEDAGLLALEAASQLNLTGEINTNRSAGARGAQIDIASQDIRVVAAKDSSGDALQLTADELNQLDAESILLGGKRDVSGNATTVSAFSDTVTVENDAENPLAVPELMVTAKDDVTVKSGATIITEREEGTQASSINLQTTGDSALLAVSGINEVNYSRTGSSAAATTGDLTVEAGANIKADQSIVLDATKENQLSGTVQIAEGGSATFGANRILLGTPSPAEQGLVVSNQTLADLGKLGKFSLSSQSEVDVYGTVDFGSADLDLTINSAGISGNLDAGNVVNITARNLELKNDNNASASTPIDAANGQLTITAERVTLTGKDASNADVNAGKTTIDGFESIAVQADELRLAKIGQTLFGSDQTTLETGRITADTGADYQLISEASLETSKLTTPIAATSELNAKEGLGAKLNIRADQLRVGGDMHLAAGNLTLQSTQNLEIVADANISAKSTTVTYNNRQVATPAGQVTLRSEEGSVNIETGALVDVSATQNAQAGQVNIVATSDGSTAEIQGTIKGTDEQANSTGKLNVDVNKLPDLTAINQQAIGFGGERHYRVRNEGNLEINGKTADATALKATKVSVTNDGGAITVSGDIDASSQKNARIDLAAKQDVTLLDGATLTAKSTADEAEGGVVTASTVEGSLDFQSGATIDVSGGDGGLGGEVLLRAPRQNVTAPLSDIVGAKKRQYAGFKVYEKQTLTKADFDESSELISDADEWMRTVAANPALNTDQFSYIPEIVVQSSDNLTVTGDISLYDWRYDPDTGAAVANNATGQNTSGANLLAGVVTLQAKGDLTIDGSLNDGFDADGEVSGHNSTSFNVVAGADTESANQLAVSDNASNLTVKNAKGGTACPTSVPAFFCVPRGFLPKGVIPAAPSGIRTGTADINIASSGNLELDNDNSVIYTAGRQADGLDGFNQPAASQKPLYLTDGGNISVSVKGDIIGAEAETSDRQVVNQWLFRQGGGSELAEPKDTSWWVRPDLFRQSLATLGGGDVAIQADGNIENFSASLPTTARFDTNGEAGSQRIDGGGNLTVSAGGDIVNGTYFIGKGNADIVAGRSIDKSGSIGTVVALQDGEVSVSAANNATLETVMNPTLFAASATNNTQPTNDLGDGSFFNTYSADSQIAVNSLTGDISLGGIEQVKSISGLVLSELKDTTNGYYPGTINTTAFGGDVTIKDIRMVPAANGDLSVLASQNVSIGNILMSDADGSLFPNPLRPVKTFGFLEAEINAVAGTPVHINDTKPAEIVAQAGSIFRTGSRNRDITLAKAVSVVAGENINDININVQNLNANDVTIISAGNDIKGLNPAINVAGPGEVYVAAGRNIDLGQGEGINSTGNKNNPALPEGAASITVVAGLGALDLEADSVDVDAYIQQYILPTGSGPDALQDDAAALAAYRQETASTLTQYIRQIEGDQTINDEAALLAFNALSDESKMIFVNRHLSSELRATGKTFPDTGSNARGFDAIATLYKEGEAQGDITLFNSKITAAAGGSVDVVAPNGLINVGLAGGSDKTDIGITTDEVGDAIRIYADKGLEVNQSKVVAKQAGDITIWVNNGDVDAGRGSKAATSAPQRIVQTDVNGNTTIRTVGVASGSGIQAQSFDPDGPGPLKTPEPGEVVIVAPRGTIDAGEAGIAGGNVFVIAPVIANAANISASGSTQGVPAAATNVAAAVGPGADSTTNSAVQEVAQNVAQSSSTPLADDLFPSLITGQFLGFGDE